MRATFESFTADGMIEGECELVLRDGQLIISYDDERGSVIYMGTNQGFGYRLECPERKGRSTMHATGPENTQFEGSWIEDGYRGMWIVDVIED
jgi:hypothetical protein